MIHACEQIWRKCVKECAESQAKVIVKQERVGSVGVAEFLNGA